MKRTRGEYCRIGVSIATHTVYYNRHKVYDIFFIMIIWYVRVPAGIKFNNQNKKLPVDELFKKNFLINKNCWDTIIIPTVKHAQFYVNVHIKSVFYISKCTKTYVWKFNHCPCLDYSKDLQYHWWLTSTQCYCLYVICSMFSLRVIHYKSLKKQLTSINKPVKFTIDFFSHSIQL